MQKIKNSIVDIHGRFERWESRFPEVCVICSYVLLLSVFMYYHEPWYDEAQAWLIARDGSWHDILFLIPHYEGHPPLWYIILACFAKLGADFDLSIKCLTLVINTCAMYLLVCKSPFPKIVRCVLPFTYFLFYQHGVICRPYSLLLVGFLLTAMFWQAKNEKPIRVILSMMLMCSSSAYGIIFAGGIAIAWLLEISDIVPLRSYFAKLFLNKTRLLGFVMLLVYAMINILLIMPRNDTFAASYGMGGNNPVWFRLLYMFFGAIADATCFSAYDDYDELRYAAFRIPKTIIGLMIGLLIVLLILYFAKQSKTLPLFFIPFVLFAGFSGIVYFYLQHIDVLLQFLIFWAWVAKKQFVSNTDSLGKYCRLAHLSTPILIVGVGFSLAVSLFWSGMACFNEVRYQYGFSQQLATFLDNYGLTEYGVMVRWQQISDENGKVIYNNTSQTVNGVALNAYYDTNVVINMNNGDSSATYVTHRIPSQEENERILAEWREEGLPAITLDRCQLKSLFPEYRDVYIQFYTDVLILPEYHLWKGWYNYSEHHLYVRNDIARKHFFS